MSKIKVRLNSAGVIALLKSSEVQADLAARAERVQAALGTGDGEEWETKNFVGKDRAQAIVKTANTAARQTIAEHPSDFISALGSGR